MSEIVPVLRPSRCEQEKFIYFTIRLYSRHVVSALYPWRRFNQSIIYLLSKHIKQ